MVNANEHFGIADRLNVDNIEYMSRPYIRRGADAAVVRFAPSSGTLTFNEKMLDLCEMKNWTHVVVGFDTKSHIIVLKQCDAEEEGSVVLRAGKSCAKKTSPYRENANKSKVISINHLVRTKNLKLGKRFRAERAGILVCLEEIEEKKEE